VVKENEREPACRRVETDESRLSRCVKSFKESHVKDLEKLMMTVIVRKKKINRREWIKEEWIKEEWIKENPIPYISNDKFSQEDMLHY
jgi:hypothetical protein